MESEGYFADSFGRTIALLLEGWLKRCWVPIQLKEKHISRKMRQDGNFRKKYSAEISAALTSSIELGPWPAALAMARPPPSNERMNECFLDPLMCAERLAERAVVGRSADTPRERGRMD